MQSVVIAVESERFPRLLADFFYLKTMPFDPEADLCKFQLSLTLVFALFVSTEAYDQFHTKTQERLKRILHYAATTPLALLGQLSHLLTASGFTKFF